MKDFTPETDWSTSSKSNCWERRDGLVLIAGKDGRYWARRDAELLLGSFSRLKEARSALADDPKGEGEL